MTIMLSCGCTTPSPLWVSTYDEAVRVLGSGYTVDSRTKSGDTMLHTAAYLTNSLEAEKIIRMLLSQGANVNAKDISDQTPLHNARTLAATRLLLEAGGNTLAKDKWQRTPLWWAMHHAKREDRLSLIQLYISHGADVNARDDVNETPLFYARTTDEINLLLSNGADPCSVNNAGVSALAKPFHPIYTGPQKPIETLSFIIVQESKYGPPGALYVEIIDKYSGNVLYKPSRSEGSKTSFQALPGSYDFKIGYMEIVGVDVQLSSISFRTSDVGRTNIETRAGTLYTVTCNAANPRNPITTYQEPFPTAQRSNAKSDQSESGK